MHRFYLFQKIDGNTIEVSDAEKLHHMVDVLRLKMGDEVFVFDGTGSEYRCVISRLEKKQAVLDILSRKLPGGSAVKIAVACALPKKAKVDDIIDKLTQLGVDEIIPMETERVVVKVGDNRESRLQRWRKIAEGAAEHSHRSSLPIIPAVMNFKEMLQYTAGYELKLVPNLEGERKEIRDIVAGNKFGSVLVVIGPEGDFSPGEVEEAVKYGFVPLSLGQNVLRVDTAAVAAAAYLRLALMT